MNSAKLALVLPGYLDTKDYPHMRSHVDFLAECGYLAISFDPPGTWGSGKDINDYSITNYLVAIDKLIEQFGNRPSLLFGHSLGGFMACLAAARNTHVETLIAAMCPHSYIRINNQERIERWREEGERVSTRDLPDAPNEQQTFKVPFSFAEDSKQFESLEGLGLLPIPKLFIAGEHDTTVRPEMVKESFNAAAEPKQFHLLNSDHDYRRNWRLINEVNRLIGEFLNAPS